MKICFNSSNSFSDSSKWLVSDCLYEERGKTFNAFNIANLILNFENIIRVLNSAFLCLRSNS